MDKEKKGSIKREDYQKIPDRKLEKLYLQFVKKSGFIPFTKWEMGVLSGEIKLWIR